MSRLLALLAVGVGLLNFAASLQRAADECVNTLANFNDVDLTTPMHFDLLPVFPPVIS